MDFSMLDLNTDASAFTYQPQVFSVLSLPEAVLDTETLSGKPSNSPFSSSLVSDDEKVELPKVERMPVAQKISVTEATVVDEVTEDDEEFDADPKFALFVFKASVKAEEAEQATEIEDEEVKEFALPLDADFIAKLSMKPAMFELVSVGDEMEADKAMVKVERIRRDLEACLVRVGGLCVDF